jgi:broad specificity phosphatase PhoE
MKLVIFRHASRSPFGAGDSLSSVGLAQAEDLAQAKLPEPTHIFVSPKKRAQQTLAPLAQVTGLAPTIDRRLDERRQNESMPDFEARVRSFLAEMESLARNSSADTSLCAFACSHLDWLELAMILLPSDLSEREMSLSWATAEYKIFEFADGLWLSQACGVIPPRG